MSEPTRTIANPFDPELVEAMARAGYDEARTKAPSLPRWDQATDWWRDAARREITAALRAAQAAGYRIAKA